MPAKYKNRKSTRGQKCKARRKGRLCGGLDRHFIETIVKCGTFPLWFPCMAFDENEGASRMFEKAVGWRANNALTEPACRRHGFILHQAASSGHGGGRMVRYRLMCVYVGQEQYVTLLST